MIYSQLFFLEDSSSPGSGTVTSVGISTGSTGLTVENSPITTSGVMSIGGVLNIANGGTGSVTAQSAANNLLPTQNPVDSGKFLSTDGSGVLSWQNAPSFSGMNLVSSPISGDILITDINGQAYDSGFAFNNTDPFDNPSSFQIADTISIYNFLISQINSAQIDGGTF